LLTLVYKKIKIALLYMRTSFGYALFNFEIWIFWNLLNLFFEPKYDWSIWQKSISCRKSKSIHN
jgi:hypothetical protein